MSVLYLPDKKKKCIYYGFCRNGSIKVVEDLTGLAVFVGGKSQTFAVPASDYPGILKPNSIYFARAHTSGFGRDEKKFSDVGVFDYEKKSFAAVYDHNYSEGGSAQDVMWFTPNPF